MSGRRRLHRAMLAVAMLAGCTATAMSAGADGARAFRVRMPIRPAPGASVQRIALPADALIALQRPDLGDLRIFDRSGKPVPIALADPPPSPTRTRNLPLKAYPILGSPGALKITGLSLKLDGERSARVVGVDGAVVDPARRGSELLGALLDVRDIRDPAVGLLLDAALPVSQPVDVTVEASADLADWRSVGRKVIYRAAAADHPVTSETIPLAGVDLRGRYLRVTWTSASRLLAPIRIRSAILTVQGDAGGAGRIVVEATTPPLRDPYHVQFTLPFGAHLAAIRIMPSGGVTMIPITLSGRADREQVWTPLGGGNVYRLRSGGAERSNDAIALPDGSFREIRIEADRRSGGFAAAPRVHLEFEPRQVVMLLSGPPPFTLAAGSETADAAYFPVRNLIPDGRLDQVPLATTGAADGAPAILTLPQSDDDRASRRAIILWLALILGTVTLGGIVWALYRSMRSQRPIDDSPRP